MLNTKFGNDVYSVRKLLPLTFLKVLAHHLVMIAFVSFFCSTASAAKIECIETGAIRLIGSIELDDQKKVSNCWETLNGTARKAYRPHAEINKNEPGKYIPLNTDVRQFVISSKGGSVSTAMQIGQFIRSKKMWVTVPADWGECLSSCVYILAAGVVRYPWGDVGIHRPYFLSSPNQSYDKALKDLLSQSKIYFQQMNVPDFLAEDMFSIPPSEIKMLGDVLLTKYRLNQTDMAFEEENAIRNAAEYGLSRQEYERRLKLSEKLAKECRNNYAYVDRNDEREASVMVDQCHTLARKRAGLTLKGAL